MKTMAITDFKAHAFQVIGEVVDTKQRIVVTKRGTPIAEIAPFTEKTPTPGKLSEALVFERDLVSPLGEEIWNVRK